MGAHCLWPNARSAGNDANGAFVFEKDDVAAAFVELQQVVGRFEGVSMTIADEVG